MAANPKAFATQYQIQIALGGTVSSNGNIKITNSDSISFKNNAGFPVNIIFTAVYGPINGLPNGGTQAPNGGPGLNTTINFSIYNANTGLKVSGPYYVEFGQGPLVVSIAGLNTNPDPIAVPALGQLQFNCDAAYNIVWKFANGLNANVWTPTKTQLPAGSTTLTALSGATLQVLTYIITDASHTRGGGTVNVGS